MHKDVLRIVKSLNKDKLTQIINDINFNIPNIVRPSKKEVEIGIYEDEAMKIYEEYLKNLENNENNENNQHIISFIGYGLLFLFVN